MRRWLVMLALFAGIMAAGSTPAGEPASIRYSKLLDYQHRLDGLKDLSRLKVDARIGASTPGINPSEITLAAKLADGETVNIPIDATGHFTVPDSAALEQQDPLFVSNQPKGSMQFSVDITLVTPEQKTLRYADLMLGVVQFGEAIDRQGFMAKLFSPSPKGLILFYGHGTHAATVHAAGGDRVVASMAPQAAQKTLKDLQLKDVPSDAAVLYLPLDDDLMKQDPEVSLDALPDSASAYF